MTTLEYIGRPSPHRDMQAYHAELVRKHPTLSEAGIQAITRAELAMTPPRIDNLVQHLIGADVIDAEVRRDDPNPEVWECPQIEAWPWMTTVERQRIAATPLAHRRTLIDPEGLSRTYVWRQTNGWIQDVTDADVEVIRRSAARHWFSNVAKNGRFTPEDRAFGFSVAERYEAKNWDDANAFLKDLERPQQWPGLLIP